MHDVFGSEENCQTKKAHYKQQRRRDDFWKKKNKSNDILTSRDGALSSLEKNIIVESSKSAQTKGLH